MNDVAPTVGTLAAALLSARWSCQCVLPSAEAWIKVSCAVSVNPLENKNVCSSVHGGLSAGFDMRESLLAAEVVLHTTGVVKLTTLTGLPSYTEGTSAA